MRDIIIFGYNEYAKNIADNFVLTEAKINVFVLSEENLQHALSDGYKARLIELNDEWDDIIPQDSIENTVCFCAIKDDAHNIFLTISLRAAFESLYIIALGSSRYSAEKLRLAGANKAIAKLETTANLIVQSLEEPAVVEVMSEILAHNEDLRLAEITIGEHSCIKDQQLHDISIHKDYNIIILAVADRETEANFSFTAEGYNHTLDEDDVLVVIGKEKDIIAFEKAIQ